MGLWVFHPLRDLSVPEGHIQVLVSGPPSTELFKDTGGLERELDYRTMGDAAAFQFERCIVVLQ